MKSIIGLIVLLVFIGALAVGSTFAAVILTNTSINAADLQYEGTEIVISNCTVTLQGSHTFASLLVAEGGALTVSTQAPFMDLIIQGDALPGRNTRHSFPRT